MAKHYEMRAAVRHVSLKLGDRRIYSYPLKVGHHFWVLVEIDDIGQEQIIEAIHGLSIHHTVDKAGVQHASMASIFETWNAQLGVYCIQQPLRKDATGSEWVVLHDKDYWMKPNETFAVHPHPADGHDALILWNNTKQFIETLNRANLPYSFFGLGKTLGLNCRNSNSIYAAIAEHLGLVPHRFEGYMAPGLNTSLLSPTMIK